MRESSSSHAHGNRFLSLHRHREQLHPADGRKAKRSSAVAEVSERLRQVYKVEARFPLEPRRDLQRWIAGRLLSEEVTGIQALGGVFRGRLVLLRPQILQDSVDEDEVS